jgi:hypothetical protein
MTRFSDDDEKLVEFLRHYQPQPPPAGLELEEQILAGIGIASPSQSSKVVKLPQRNRYRGWVASGAIAASLVAGILGYQHLKPASPNDQELAGIESFLEANWDSTVPDNSDNELLPL